MVLYRNAHWWLLALIPLTIVAFWPGYYSQISNASLAHHIHGSAGMAWMLLAIVQSWSIAGKRITFHRSTGQAVYVIVPLFVAGGALAILEMARGYVSAVDPFRAAFGAKLALLDLSAAILMPLFMRDALIHRRNVSRHAASMLASVVLILPPMVGRLLQHVPSYPPGFPAGMYGGQLIASAIALWLWLRDRRNGGAFLVVALIAVSHCLLFAVYNGEGLTRAVAPLAPLPTAAMAAGAAALLLWLARPKATVEDHPAIAN